MNDYREYQHKAARAVFEEFAKGVRSTMVVMPTGSGKTNVAGMIAQEASEAFGWRTLFVAHREILVNQAADRLVSHFALDTMIEMGRSNAWEDWCRHGRSEVVVGTVQTMQGDRLRQWPEDSFDLVIVDECHRAKGRQHQATVGRFPEAKLLGITATPDGGPIAFRGRAFDYPLREAIADGYLVPIVRRVCPVPIDLRDISTRSGDFNRGDLAERIGPNVEALCRAMMQEIGDLSTVVFAPGVGTGAAMADVLTKLGVKACYVAGDSGIFGQAKGTRKATLGAFERGEFQVVVCCDLLIEGWDCTHVACVVIARPTRLRYRFAQMVGRGTRPHPSPLKERLLVVDFDWKTNEHARDLVTEIDLFGDEIHEDARPLLRARLKRDPDVDMLTAIRDAEQTVRLHLTLGIPLTGASCEYQAYETSPAGVAKMLGIKWKPSSDMLNTWTRNKPPTDGQVRFLHALGVRSTDGMSFFGATKLIDKLKKRRDKGMASVTQVATLLSSGVAPIHATTMTERETTRALIEIKASQATFF